jgi:hypothetical protein
MSRPSDYLIVARVLNGAMKRSTCISRSDISPALKRSNRLGGSCVILTGGMNRSRTDCQNELRGKSSRHHARHRCNVRLGILNRSHRACPDVPPGGEVSINTTARYTRRPANRTEGEVERASHRPHVKLNRRE